ncbi:MAG: biopolymer transporter ExbD [Synergistaceae bacterium]|jgi:biopolymer transport protein ExbD|nr:biopolymer transporter ExbD [Synergistaceae bacterium]
MRGRRGADIDVTPLIDILFMLIIFFVLAASFLQGRLTVELPRGEGSPGKAESPVLVTLTRGGSVFWGSLPEPVASADVLRLAAENLSSDREILVAGDREVSYGAVVELLEVLRSAGAERLGLALQVFGEPGEGSARK